MTFDKVFLFIIITIFNNRNVNVETFKQTCLLSKFGDIHKITLQKRKTY